MGGQNEEILAKPLIFSRTHKTYKINILYFYMHAHCNELSPSWMQARCRISVGSMQYLCWVLAVCSTSAGFWPTVRKWYKKGHAISVSIKISSITHSKEEKWCIGPETYSYFSLSFMIHLSMEESMPTSMKIRTWTRILLVGTKKNIQSYSRWVQKLFIENPFEFYFSL